MENFMLVPYSADSFSSKLKRKCVLSSIQYADFWIPRHISEKFVVKLANCRTIKICRRIESLNKIGSHIGRSPLKSVSFDFVKWRFS